MSKEVMITYKSFKEVNKLLLNTELVMNDEGYLSVMDKATNKELSIIPFEDIYNLDDIDKVD